MSSSEGYELFALPFETIIGINEESTTGFNRLSVQSGDSFSNKTNSKGLYEMRQKFETFLSQDELLESFEYNLQKLFFLDHFYDCKRKKSIKFKKQELIFQNCNSLLSLIALSSNEQLIVNSEQNNSFLSQFQSIIEENPNLFPLFKKNQSAFDWFAAQQEKLNLQPKLKLLETNSEIEDFDDEELERIIYMFMNSFKYLFYYFQKTNCKFIKKWMKENLSSLPKYILDEMKVKYETRRSLTDLLAYKENELNSSTILDADFDFLTFLSSNTGDWRLLSNLSNVSDVHVYCSNENYMSTPKSKIVKIIYTVDKSIEEFSKAFLSYDFSKDEKSYRIYEDYEPLNSNSSSRKYSIIKGKFIMESKIPLIARKVSDAVFTTKPKFIGNKLFETMALFKTTSTLKDNEKCIAMGGTIIRKVDETSCQFIQISMFYVSSVLTHLILEKFAIKLYLNHMKDFIERIYESTLQKTNNSTTEDNPKMLWKTFCDYCQTYHNITAEQDL